MTGGLSLESFFIFLCTFIDFFMREVGGQQTSKQLCHPLRATSTVQPCSLTWQPAPTAGQGQRREKGFFGRRLPGWDGEGACCEGALGL